MSNCSSSHLDGVEETDRDVSAAYDQPDFNAAMYIAQPLLRILGRSFNALVQVDYRWAANIRMMHFCYSNHYARLGDNSVLGKFLECWESTGRFEEATFRMRLRSRNPYCQKKEPVRIKLAVGDFNGALGRIYKLFCQRISK